jgi:hypothetical protein
MDASLASMLTQTITLEPHTGQDAYGQPTYGAAVAHAARVEWVEVLVQTPTGAERSPRQLVFLAGPAIPDLRDRLTLPDGAQHALQQVSPVYDETGVLHHVEVTL